MDEPLDFDTDIVVVGAGACGLMAAYRAGLKGLEVLLLEKDTRTGCNAEIASGSIPAAGTPQQQQASILDSVEQMAEDILRKCKRQANPEIVYALCARSAEIVRIFESDLGVPMRLNLDAGRFGFSALRLHNADGRTGAPLIRALHRALAEMDNVTFADRTPGVGLISGPNGAVIGVLAGHEKIQRIGAQRIILACDGFGANKDMIAEYIPAMRGVESIGVQGNTGDAIRWCMTLGAAVAHMSGHQGHGLVCKGYGTRLVPEIPQLGAVIVNQAGVRFTREDQGYSEFAHEVLAQPGGIAIAIFDQAMVDVVAPLDHWRDTVASGAIKTFNSLEELAARFNLPWEAVQRSLEQCRHAATDPWGRSSLPIPSTGPFYGAIITGAMVHTQGGVVTDIYGRVCRPDGSTITNLYAGGGTAAGISGDDAAGYLSGNGLLSAYGGGLIAGDHAAHSIIHGNKDTRDGVTTQIS